MSYREYFQPGEQTTMYDGPMLNNVYFQLGGQYESEMSPSLSQDSNSSSSSVYASAYYSTSQHYQDPVSPTLGCSGSEPSSPSDSTPSRKSKKDSIYPCLHPGCQTSAKFKRCADLERHIQTVHFPVRYDCPFKWCGRVGENAFTRKDHLRDHEREVHMQEIPKVRQSRSGKR